MTTELREQYTLVRERATRLKDALIQQLTHLLTDNSITLAVPMEGRVKDWNSIEDKILRKSIATSSIYNFDDLIGVRTILLFKRDLLTVDNLIKTNLSVLHSEDTASRLTENQFGYQSQHYIVKFPDSWLSIPSHAEFAGLKIEIQLRTAAQHIWAAASHKLQYKHETSVPLPLRRSIHRISALLEIVDLEFDRLLDERQEYVTRDPKKVDVNEVLNVDSVERVLTKNLPLINRRDDESYAELVEDLLRLGITKPKDLEVILRKHMKKIKEEEDLRADSEDLAAYFQHVGLARNALRLEFGDGRINELFEIRKKDKRA